ncbi:MAG TPA: PfkB family carbohydrate kinase [Bryobacteraceae bacterium]|nr:PfkB family carbohydrate kinase [Bryobacteraceae bacterium]
MTTAEILAQFPKLSALVVGDICLDRWCTYDPAASEPSRETGIPRIGVVRTEVTPGAGGTVANNLAALGAGKIGVLGVVGDDGFGHELASALSRRSISRDMLICAPGLQTFTYTKLINSKINKEDLPRIDFISTGPIPSQIERKILDRLALAVDEYDVILVSDQAETFAGGVITPAVRDLLADLVTGYPDKVFWVDSRARIELFRKVVIKPNRAEAEAACIRLFGHQENLQVLREYCDSSLMMVTDGPNGVLVVEPAQNTFCRTKPISEPVDICGAGDSFSAGAALALAVTRSPVEAARFGNLVASVTIMKKGTGTASPAEVLEAASK